MTQAVCGCLVYVRREASVDFVMIENQLVEINFIEQIYLVFHNTMRILS